jgi:DNA-binding protein HU-beta
MNKSELVAAIADGNDFSVSAVENVINKALEVITRELAGGGDITIKGFGNFTVKSTAARDGRNPKTGESIKIPAGKKVSFKAGTSLKDAIK